jgi:hypothetical protein
MHLAIIDEVEEAASALVDDAPTSRLPALFVLNEHAAKRFMGFFTAQP